LSRAPNLLESHVQQTVTEFLQLDGWRAIRTDPVSDRKRGKGFGEIGMPDHLYIRYGVAAVMPESGHISDTTFRMVGAACQVIWIEFKAPGKAAKPHQLTWHEAESDRGALVMVVDDIDGFIAWYKASGLQRRRSPAKVVMSP
jgi:hypothetical protein